MSGSGSAGDRDRDRRDEKRPFLALPIPTYEEATSSRTSDAGDPDDDDDRDGESARLLQRGAPSDQSRRAADSGSRGRYQPPTVESVRSSMESSFLEEFASARSSAESLQREMVQMEVLDGGESGDGAGRHRGLRQSLSKGISAISLSLSSLSERLPPNPFRGWKWLWIPELPQIPFLRQSLVPVYRLAAVLLGLIVVYAVLASDALTFSAPMNPGMLGPFDPESVRDYARQGPQRENILNYLKYLTSFDHIAGTEGDYVLAKWVKGKFASFGLDAVDESTYYVYLNYPRKDGREVSIVDPPWKAVLDEPAVDAKHENTLAFHGNSKTGTAVGPLVYANYGAREDFDTLEKQGVSVKGAIVLVRYGGTEGDRALKIKAAELKGAAGVLIFSDPKTEGWDWPGTALQRGGVSLMSFIAGDVLTPGYPALEDAKRIGKEDNPGLVQIPSLPLSPNDAAHLLRSIRGVGQKVSEDWTGAVRGVDEWWTGTLDKSPRVTLKNEQSEEDAQPIWNIHGHIRGTDDSQKRIIVGNHRDAWCFGAGDPNSGTAVMLEVMRVFGEMMKFGWRPARSISFMSWDAEEYNLVGSTEWVEDNVEELRRQGFTYVNLDGAVTGPHLSASGSPALKSAFLSVLGRVPAPNEASAMDAHANPENDKLPTNTTLRDLWGDKEMPGLGAGSDYVAFQDYAGVSSIDFSFEGANYPYHSCLDNWHWMTSVGDPAFLYHEAAARILVLLILDLADTPILPYNMTDYAIGLGEYVADLKAWTEKHGAETEVDLKPLEEAVSKAKGYMDTFMAQDEDWMETDERGLPKLMDETARVWRRDRSARMSNFDKHLLDLDEGGGVPGREWFKHVVFAPQAWSGYDPGYFPGIRDAVEARNWTLARSQVEKISRIIEKAALKLLH